MSWPAVILLAVCYVALVVRVAYWIGGLLRDAGVLLDRADAGQCTCTRYRLCAACLTELRGTTNERKVA